MWFRNLQIYRLPTPWAMTADALREQLARCHGGSIRFKVVDADGGVIEQYGPTKPNGITCWHEP